MRDGVIDNERKGRNERRVERRGVNVLKKLLKKGEEIIQREPTSLPTGRSAYMYCKVKTSK